MNNLEKWKMRIIRWLAGDEPIMLNFVMNTTHLPDGISVVYLPMNDVKYDAEVLGAKAVLYPEKNVKTK